MRKKIILYLSTILIFFLAFLILFIGINLLGMLTDIYPPGLSHVYISIYAVATFFIPVFFGVLLSRLFIQWYAKKKIIRATWLPKSRILIWSFILLYLFTAFAGIPSVQSFNSKWAINEYKRMNTGDSKKLLESLPYMRSYLSVPVLPLTVMSYHEYQLAGLYGWGGWDIQFWYIFGVKRIMRLPLWVS